MTTEARYMLGITSPTGQGAAAKGDEAGHGATTMGQILGGSAEFTVGGRPAARAGIDFVDCSADMPRPIITGSSTVSWGGHPAARKGDFSHCDSAILTGDPTVLIGGDPVKVINCNCTPCKGYIYKEHTLEYLRRNKNFIYRFTDPGVTPPNGVTAFMLAAAVAEEYNRRWWEGRWAKVGNEIQALAPGEPLLWLDEQLDSIHRLYVNSGPGNIKVATALQTVGAHEDEFREKMNYWGTIGPNEMPDILLQDEGTFLVASLYLRDMNQMLKDHDHFVEGDDGHSPEDWGAVVVSAYREGDAYVGRANENRAKHGDRVPPYRIEAGVGCGACLQSRIIEDAIGSRPPSPATSLIA